MSGLKFTDKVQKSTAATIIYYSLHEIEPLNIAAGKVNVIILRIIAVENNIVRVSVTAQVFHHAIAVSNHHVNLTPEDDT